MAKKSPDPGTPLEPAKASTSRQKRSPGPVQRDVGSQSKGPRLQRLRAVLLVLKATTTYPHTRQQVAVETFGDVFHSTADSNGLATYHEENKNYSQATTFTMNSIEILNSIVSFCDCWIYHGFSPNVRFGFYAPNTYAKERNTERTTKLGITWPTELVLQLLESGDFSTPVSGFIDAVRKSIIACYKEQADIHKEAAAVPTTSPRALSHLSLIEKWNDDDWITFLKQIEWKFREDDADTIEGTVVAAVQSSQFYNSQHAGKEWQIVAQLMDLLV